MGGGGGDKQEGKQKGATLQCVGELCSVLGNCAVCWGTVQCVGERGGGGGVRREEAERREEADEEKRLDMHLLQCDTCTAPPDLALFFNCTSRHVLSAPLLIVAYFQL